MKNKNYFFAPVSVEEMFMTLNSYGHGDLSVALSMQISAQYPQGQSGAALFLGNKIYGKDLFKDFAKAFGVSRDETKIYYTKQFWIDTENMARVAEMYADVLSQFAQPVPVVTLVKYFAGTLVTIEMVEEKFYDIEGSVIGAFPEVRVVEMCER